MGYIKDGKYYKGKVDMDSLQRKSNNSTFKTHEHNRQRKDFAREIVQPYNRDGKPNPEFIEAWPEESKEYGFLPKDEDLRSE